MYVCNVRMTCMYEFANVHTYNVVRMYVYMYECMQPLVFHMLRTSQKHCKQEIDKCNQCGLLMLMFGSKGESHLRRQLSKAIDTFTKCKLA